MEDGVARSSVSMRKMRIAFLSTLKDRDHTRNVRKGGRIIFKLMLEE
jgi:hypothetical protein